MAEFLTESEASEKYGSKAKANAGLTLGIIGTALAAIGLGGNGILGMRNGVGNNGPSSFGAGLVGGEILGYDLGISGPTKWQLSQQETQNQDYDLIRMGQIEIDSLKTAMASREADIAEKVQLYSQTLADNENLRTRLEADKDFMIQGLKEVGNALVQEDKVLERQITTNQMEAFKNNSDLWAKMIESGKSLEIQIERNREVDQSEKFQLYKELSGQTTALAFQTMKQSYEDRLEASSQVQALSARVCQLEKESAVQAAQIPLMFQLAGSQTKNDIETATCRKIDGNLTLSYGQIQSPVPPQSISALYASPYVPFPTVPVSNGVCTGTTTV